MKNYYLKPLSLKYILSLLIVAMALNTHAQVTIVPAKDNFTHFSADKSYADLEKLRAMTPASFQSNPDFGKCFTTHANWYEQIEKRTLNSRSYSNDSGQIITQYGYDNINYTDSKGWLRAVDTKLKPLENGWAATQQENPTYLYKDASTALSVGNDQLITFNKNVQFNSTSINPAAYTVGDNGMMIKNVVANTDKIIRFKRNTIETDYLVNTPLNLSGDLIISEDIILPAGYSISQVTESDNTDEAGSLVVIGPDGKEKAVLKVPACYDNGKNETLGSYHIINQEGGYRLEIVVPSSWINSSSRKYPITIDPVVTGTTAKWTGGKIASCMYPNFGSGTMAVSIPAGITITGFYIQSSYYANPLKNESLDDGLIYFGTKCGSTGLSSINPPQGDSSGIGTFSLTDFHSSLACCMYPSCSPQTINLTMYLSRTAGGNTCDSQYIYYDPANTDGYNFEAYIVGNTVELNNSQWSVSPSLLCGNDCSLTLTATINYGVPPYTISHPWAGSNVTVGKYDTTICGSTGSTTITLTIPNCPIASCTSTLLTVPPPTITDACGTSVQGLTNQFITVKPVPTVVAFPDSQEVCSGSPFDITLTSCVSGTTFTWTGSDGSSGSGSPIVDPVPDTSSTAKIINFTITPSAGGCTGKPVVIPVTIEPIPTSSFTIAPSQACVNGKIAVTYKGTKINGATYNWNFGGGTLVSGSATGPGPDTISFATTGSHVITLSVTANGCTSVLTSNTVTVIPGPVITVTPSPANICLGNSTKLSASGGNSYTWSPSTSLNSTTGSSVSANPASTTIYSVTGSSAATGCSTTIKDTVNVSSKPVITANPSPASFCSGGSSTLTASGGTTYTWSPSTGLSATTGGTVTASPTITTKYIVTGTNAGGCSSTDTVTVTVNPKPIINASPSSTSYCPGGSATLTASGGVTYTWSPSTGLSATTGSSVTANSTTTTTYTITGTNSNGCSATDNVIVTVNPNPIIVVNPSPVTVCSGTPAILSASGASTYTWSPSTSLSSTVGSSVSASPVSTTVYTVTGTSSKGCTATATDTVNVNAKPVIIAKASRSSVCSDSTTVLTATGAGNYTWFPSTGLSATSGSSVVATPTITTIYSVTGSNGNGCVDTASVTVTVIKPSIIVTPKNPAYCIGGNTTLTASGLNSYTWTPSAGLNSSTGDTVIADPTVTSTYTVSGTDSIGCYGAVTFTLTVNKNPIGSVSPKSAAICDGSTTTLTASGAGYYFWFPSTGLSSSTGDSVKASPVVAVTYTVIGVDSNGCEDTTKVPISIKPVPVITATPSTVTTCYGDSVLLTAHGGNTYAWSPSTGLSATNDSSANASPFGTTKYIVTGTDTDKCSDTASILVKITPGPVVTVSPSKPEICLGDTTVLLASGALTYLWSPGQGLSCTTCSNPIDSSTVTSQYIVQGTASSGCKSFDTITVKVDTPAKITVSKDTFVCQGQSVQLSATNSNGVISWSPAIGLSCSTCNNPVASPSATTTYVVSAVNGACSVSDSVTVAIGEVSLTVGPDQHIKYTQSAQLTANGTDHYVWTPGNSLDDDTLSSPVATPSVTTTYYVTGNNGQGCSVTDTVVVYVADACESLKVPSGFVPNGGDQNAYLHILGFNGVQLNTFQVFNRWGQLVYETADFNDRGWDGTYNGKPQPMGTYVYYAELVCEGNVIHMRGNVTLIR